MTAQTQEYRHTQVGYVLLACAAGVAALLFYVVTLPAIRQQPWMVTALILAPGVCGMLALVAFSSLTIAVHDGMLTWYFGPGIARHSIPVSEITAAEPTRTSPLLGWGIRWTPDGWLYNVGGLNTVTVRSTRRTVLLGTDEPLTLANALGARAGGGRPS